MPYNYSYHALPLLFLQVIFNSSRGAFMRLKCDDNANPRIVLDALEKSGKYSPKLIAKLRRKESCEKNLWEGMPMIIGAVVAGNTAGLSADWMNGVVGVYFVARVAYAWAYVNITSKRLSYFRSLFWWTANFCSLVTFVKAGRAMNKA